MAITFDRLQELLRGEKLKFYVDPDQPVARLMIQGLFGRHEIAVLLQEEGAFLQLRTVGYGRCPVEHQHLEAVLRVVAQVNYVRRLVKIGWDPGDGEIVGYADLWITDNQVTQQQFHRMMSNFIPAIDQAHARIKTTLETGKDPGDQDVAKALRSGGGGGGAPEPMPPALKDVLDKLSKRDAKPGKSEDGESLSEI